MLPQIHSLDSSSAGTIAAVPPPPRFRGVVGSVISATMVLKKPLSGPGLTVAHKNGIRYEGKAQKFLAETFPSYIPSPTIHFYDKTGFRSCIPDGLLLEEDRTIIFEIKIQHMPEAWWQLNKLYDPVIRQAIRHKPIQCIEVVRSYDPAMPFPCEHTLIEDIQEFVRISDPSRFGVLLCRI